jgi:hypothetical protein
VVLVDQQGETILDFIYRATSPWPAAAAGGGASLEVIDPTQDLSSAENWRASQLIGGSPGSQNPEAPVKLDGISLESGELRFTFQGKAGFGYTIHVCDSLPEARWTVLERGEPLLQGERVEVRVGLAPAESRFFRVSIP